MVKAIITADWHLGAINPNDFYKQLESTLFKKLYELEDENEYIDYLIIAGDIFDSKQYFASEAVSVAFKIFTKLAEFESVIDTVIILDGTRTHDANQLSLLSEVCNNIVPVVDGSGLCIYHVEKAECYFDKHDFSMLLLPEEYVENQDDYYAKYFTEDSHYDFIIGHGMIDKIWYAKKNKEQHGATQITMAPVFKLDELTRVGNYTFFGHVHTHKFYNKDKFRYLGPVTRWEFGSSSEVGITYIEYDELNKVMVKDEFIKNELAPYLPTRIINLKDRDNYDINEVNDIVDNILSEEIANGASKIRFIVNLNNNLSNASAIKDFLLTKIGEIPMAKLVLSEDFDSNVIDNMKESLDIERNTIEYKINRNLDVEERIRKFIIAHHEKDITIEKIKEYLEIGEE